MDGVAEEAREVEDARMCLGTLAMSQTQDHPSFSQYDILNRSN